MICHYAPSYSRFLNNGIAMGAYGPRIFQSAAWEDIANELFRGETRRAVIPIYGLDDLRNTRAGLDIQDIPCTLSLQFLNRNGELHMITNMRSNDVWLGLPYDCFCFMMIQLMMCEITGLKPGKYWHQAGSMHIYEKNMDLFSKMSGLDSSYIDKLAREVTDEETEPLMISYSYDTPTLQLIPALRKEEQLVRNGAYMESEGILAKKYRDFSISTTLLTLASCQNYHQITDKDIQRLSQFVDSSLIIRAAEIVNRREHK